MATLKRLPMTIEEITPEWVSREFAALHPGVAVTGLAIEKVIDGTATKLKLKLDYNAAGQAAGLPPTMWLKIGLNPLHLEIGASYFQAEARFYRDIAPGIDGLTLPHCYLARGDQESDQAAIFLEDLEPRGVRFGDIRDGISIEIAYNLLDWLAILHARYWGDPMLQEMSSLPTDRVVGFSAFVLQPDEWEKTVAGSRARGVPAELLDRDRIERAYLGMLRANAAGPQCLIHGDLHMGNMFFLPDGAAGYLDWQGVKRGSWAYDVAYFITGNVPIEVRRAQEKDLLRFYLDRLAAHVARFRPGAVTLPDWDEAWLAYRQNLVRGYCWIGCPVSTQPEEICALNSERFVAAAIDHDMLGACAEAA